VTNRANTQAKYNDLLQKALEARVAQGLEKEQKGERFTLIDPPLLPEKPFKPNRLAIALIGILLGTGAGVGFATLRELMDNAVHSPDSLTKLTGFPVLGGVPFIRTQEDEKRKRLIVFAIIGAAGILAAAAAIVFHFLVMNLEVLWAKVLQNLWF
jgi:hypothetical protein